MSIGIAVIGNVVLGVMALGAIVIVWGRPSGLTAESDERAAALARLERECEQRAAWTNPHARPSGTGEPFGERRNGASPHLRLVSSAESGHVREATPVS
jgi:hypothetical protein